MPVQDPPPPSTNLNPHHWGYLRVWYVIFDVKRKKPLFFYISLAKGPHPLVICKCIYFCTNMRICIDLGEKYGAKFGLSILFIKIVDF